MMGDWSVLKEQRSVKAVQNTEASRTSASTAQRLCAESHTEEWTEWSGALAPLEQRLSATLQESKTEYSSASAPKTQRQGAKCLPRESETERSSASAPPMRRLGANSLREISTIFIF